MDEGWGIGRLARASGLRASALRFYDQAGVLPPAGVDERTGYRWYRSEQVVVARLIARLRRVGMPLDVVREVLAARAEPARAAALVDAHLTALEQGLAQARRELAAITTLLTRPHEEAPTTRCDVHTQVTVAGVDLAVALRAVRFAVGTDDEVPALGGLLFDLDDRHLTVVATDRYRLAVAAVAVDERSGPNRAVVTPAQFVDALVALDDQAVHLDLHEDAVIASGGAIHHLSCQPIAEAYPDYQQLLPDPSPAPLRVTDRFRAALTRPSSQTMRRERDGVDFDVAVLGIDPDGEITLVAGEHTGQGDRGSAGVGVNREFLLEAITAGGSGQLTLALEGPISPLVIRSPRSLSLLMPVRT